ncbi:MAG: hypothetical protein JNK27_02750 [Chitinophagaceae bacterium]|nr:hypothetical protein [Chitinophagaceae bacterium]
MKKEYMTRGAALYYLTDIDYSLIKNEIEFDTDVHQQSLNIAMFQNSNHLNIQIALSVSEKVDAIIEKHGGKKAELNDLYIYALKTRLSPIGTLLFGEESLIDFLPSK